MTSNAYALLRPDNTTATQQHHRASAWKGKAGADVGKDGLLLVTQMTRTTALVLIRGAGAHLPSYLIPFLVLPCHARGPFPVPVVHQTTCNRRASSIMFALEGRWAGSTQHGAHDHARGSNGGVYLRQLVSGSPSSFANVLYQQPVLCRRRKRLLRSVDSRKKPRVRWRGWVWHWIR